MFKRISSFLIASFALASAALAATPPFTEPADWSTICDKKSAASTPLVRGSNCRWLKLDGVWRRYIVFIPKNVAPGSDGKWPVVFMLHGSNQTGEDHWKTSRWRVEAAKNGLIAIFPTGWRYVMKDKKLHTKWNSFDLISDINPNIRLDGYPATSPFPARDVVFLDRIIADVASGIRIDRKRIYGSGFSNGGTMIARLVAQRSQIFAALSCAGFCVPAPSTYKPARNVPLLYGLGNRDQAYINTVNKHVTPDISILPMPWADVEQYVMPFNITSHLANLHLSTTKIIVTDGAPRTSVIWKKPLAGNRDGNVFAFDLMQGLEHNYAFPGNNPSGYSFAQRSWSFFKGFRLP